MDNNKQPGARGARPLYGSRMWRSFQVPMPEHLRYQLRKAAQRAGVSQCQFIRDAIETAMRSETVK